MGREILRQSPDVRSMESQVATINTDANPMDQDVWLFTGDVTTINPNGYMEIVDRTKDPHQIWGRMDQLDCAREHSPSRIRTCWKLLIVAANHAKLGERPVLVVTLKEGKTLDKAGILALYKGRVPKWWMPDDVVTLEWLPHTATGKPKTSSRTSRALSSASHGT
jgi:3-(methylthio)propionyl---CoA ligase